GVSYLRHSPLCPESLVVNRCSQCWELTSLITNQRVLITGGAGFIGVSLAERLCHDNEVILFDRAFESMPYAYSACKDHPNVHAVEGDVLDFARLAEHVRAADIVIHLAAIVGVNRVRQNARETINVNFIGTSNGLRAAE